jgi:8-oxo-dGTP pyrophosphatase MutT (NUDIX family)
MSIAQPHVIRRGSFRTTSRLDDLVLIWHSIGCDTVPVSPKSELVEEIYAIVDRIAPIDDVEEQHRIACLAWLLETDDVFRRAKPATPSPHLVSYFVLHDDRDGGVLLVDHVGANLWLPAGGHVEPGEHPAATVRREMWEELGVPAVFSKMGERPFFVTVTETVGRQHERHTDMSLWFLLEGRREQVFTPDQAEFRTIRWWTPDELAAADPTRFDPHMTRMIRKLPSALHSADPED